MMPHQQTCDAHVHAQRRCLLASIRNQNEQTWVAWFIIGIGVKCLEDKIVRLTLS